VSSRASNLPVAEQTIEVQLPASFPHSTMTRPETRPTYPPPAVVTNIAGEQMIHVTFTSTGPPISSYSANYTIMQQDEVTRTVGATSVSMSARDSTASLTNTNPSNQQT